MHIKQFIQYIQSEKRFSEHTITAYSKDLEQFSSFISSEYNTHSVTEINHHMIRSWVVFLVDQNTSARSVNRKLSTLKTYYKYLLRNKLVKENPMSKIPPLKPSKKLPEFVSSQHMDLLLDEVAFEDGFEGVRNKLIIEILYYTGMRLSELINLKDSDIDLNSLHLKVLGKRNKERLIPFEQKLKNSIYTYINCRNSKFDGDVSNQYFLLTSKGRKIYKKLVYRVVNSYLSRVSTLQKTSPHILRHTFATHMLNNGADLNAIKEILGHANLSATQVYTHNTIDKLKTIYKQAHPRA
jgi:integrase/recombinase XerC